MNLCGYFLDGKSPDAPALLTLTKTYTYGELTVAAERVAAVLAQAGGRAGDRALILAENELFWVAAYLGILRSGLVAVPIPPTISAPDLSSIILSVEPRIAFVQSRLAIRHSDCLRGVTTVLDSPSDLNPSTISIDLTNLTSSDATVVPAVATAPTDLAALMFTSGSTGRPRGVIVTTDNIIANTESIVDYLQLTSRDRVLAVLPFHYCFGASLLHTHLRVGGSLVIESRFMYVETVLERLASTECTGFAGVPSHYQILVRKSSIARRIFPHLRYVQQAGGHLAPVFVDALRNALPQVDIFVMYGQTEATARLAYLPPAQLEHKSGSIGIPIPGVKISVLDSSGSPVSPGNIGEIVAEGRNITGGYWKDDAATAKKFRDGKLYTGDLATIDREGFIFIVDRAGDFLKCGGKRVSCSSVEDILLQCPLIVEAAVVPVPDAVLGEAVRAVVVPRDRRTDSIVGSLQTFCRATLPFALVPKEICVVDKLPKNSSGKILKQSLREQPLPTVASELPRTEVAVPLATL